MSHFCNNPKCSPIRFVPSTSTPGKHFYDDWHFNRVLPFENQKVKYFYKWQKYDTTKLQCESTISPEKLYVYDAITKAIVKTIDWNIAIPGTVSNIWEAIVELDNLPMDKVYFFYYEAILLSVQFKWVSEPVLLKLNHPLTSFFKYWNSYNTQGVQFSSGIQFGFRCEAAIMDFQPEGERSSYINQSHDVATLSATPYNTYKLYVGTAPGVATYILDILNRASLLDHFLINDMAYQRTEGAKLEVTRVKGWPLVGGALEITEAFNIDSSQQNTESTPAPGLVTAYNIQTNFFGDTLSPAAITDIETII